MTIAKQPEVTFGDKIKAYWYPTTESTVAKRDTVRMNVPRPTTNDKAVQDYSKDLDDNFEGNVVKVAKTSATQNQYYDWKFWAQLILMNLRLHNLKLQILTRMVLSTSLFVVPITLNCM